MNSSPTACCQHVNQWDYSGSQNWQDDFGIAGRLTMLAAGGTSTQQLQTQEKKRHSQYAVCNSASVPIDLSDLSSSIASNCLCITAGLTLQQVTTRVTASHSASRRCSELWVSETQAENTQDTALKTALQCRSSVPSRKAEDLPDQQ